MTVKENIDDRNNRKYLVICSSLLGVRALTFEALKEKSVVNYFYVEGMVRYNWFQI